VPAEGPDVNVRISQVEIYQGTYLGNFDWGLVDEIWRLVEICQVRGCLFLLFKGKSVEF
jgi:hypothetical protein